MACGFRRYADEGRLKTMPSASVVIPAYNDERGVARLLDALVTAATVHFDIVVCNGCTDETASVARSFGERVRVLETEIPSKVRAMRLGDEVTDVFPRLYVDADVLIDSSSVMALVDALRGPILASAPGA